MSNRARTRKKISQRTTAGRSGIIRGHGFAWFNTGALCLSLLVAYHTRVFFFDVKLLHEWGQSGFSRELLHIYQRSRSNLEYIYPPLGIYLCAALAKLLGLLGIEWPSRAALFVYRIPPILGVYAGAFLARDIGDRLYSGGRGFLVGALYALCPPLLFASAVWGQWDSILVLAIVALVWAGVTRKDYLFGPIVGAALMFKPQIAFVFPVLIVHLIRTLGVRKCLVNCLLGALVILILISPFLLAGAGMELAHHYLRAPSILAMRSVGAYNLWAPDFALERAISGPALSLPYELCCAVGLALWAVIVVVALRDLLKRHSWEAFTEALIITLFGAFCVLTSMHERSSSRQPRSQPCWSQEGSQGRLCMRRSASPAGSILPMCTNSAYFRVACSAGLRFPWSSAS